MFFRVSSQIYVMHAKEMTIPLILWLYLGVIENQRGGHHLLISWQP